MNFKRGGMGLLLIELLIALMFFSLSSAICLQLFVSARQLSDRSAELSRAVIEAQSIAECFKAGIIAGYSLENTHLDAHEYRWDFDESWEPTDFSPTYYAVLSYGDLHGGVLLATVTVYSEDETEIVKLDVASVSALVEDC